MEQGNEMERIKKDLQDAQWFLGEERAKNQTLENRVKDLESRLQESDTQLHNMRAHAANLQKELQDTQWYLGEERARRQFLETQTRNVQH